MVILSFQEKIGINAHKFRANQNFFWAPGPFLERGPIFGPSEPLKGRTSQSLIDFIALHYFIYF